MGVLKMGTELTATAKKLERIHVQSQVWHLLESRLEKDELVPHNIVEDEDAALAPVAVGCQTPVGTAVEGGPDRAPVAPQIVGVGAGGEVNH
ncbi:hypothetical protein PF005_g10681 [Phytophthora fragariae]|uniref:Uncharacterized protein n=2 Tax=Phytophthora fragariae TaxID=53985 RepID=A0A6A3QJW6_9STRA|nr:hypothetical protein PF007_g24530 [Phytophthora fragariae]KAE9212207.1 hypothetical protein PF005_g10681 [Phytophthora fragariae]KAE9307633.1 hypothetical protein PF001_g11520 [Phytophthora fragariae]